jgi:hypothetical protein
MGGGTDGAPHICYAAWSDWNGERNVNVNRNDNDWNDDWWVAAVRNLLHFQTLLISGVFVFLFVRANHRASDQSHQI